MFQSSLFKRRTDQIPHPWQNLLGSDFLFHDEDGSERFSDQRRWKYERSDHIAVAGRLEGKATQTFYLGIIQTAFELSKGQTGLEVG